MKHQEHGSGDLLIGVVEVIGRGNCDSGSFFHCQSELP